MSDNINNHWNHYTLNVNFLVTEKSSRWKLFNKNIKPLLPGQISPRGHHLYLTPLKVNFEERLKFTFVAHLIKSSGYVTVDETIPAKAPAVSRNNGRCSLGSWGIFRICKKLKKIYNTKSTLYLKGGLI